MSQYSPSRVKPILIRPNEVISLKQAATIAGRDIKIVRGWIEQYGIGRQVAPGARIDVSRIALEMLLHGDHDALEKLREGDRVSGEVARYFSFSGIQE